MVAVRKSTKKKPKYQYLWILQGNYGHGWEDLTAETTFTEITKRLKEYKENEGGRYRRIKRRVRNT